MLMFFVRTNFTVIRANFAHTGGTTGVVVGGLVSFMLKSLKFFLVNCDVVFKSSVTNVVKAPTLFVRKLSSAVPKAIRFVFRGMFTTATTAVMSKTITRQAGFDSCLICSFVVSLLVCPVSKR